MNKLIILFFVLALIAPFNSYASVRLASAQGTTVEIGSATTVTGGTAKVPITVKNLTKREGLGGYDLQVRYDPAALRINNLAPGTSPYFGVPVHNINNVEGVVYLNGFHARVPGPTGDINLASLEVQALVSGKWTLEMRIITLADTQGSDVPASPGNGIVEAASSPAIEVGSAFLPLNKPALVPVLVKDIPADKSLASYSLKISFSPPTLKINSVKGGDRPFDRTPTFSVDAGQASVTISGSQLPSAGAQKKAVLAYIDVTSASADRVSAAIAITSLKSQGGADVAANTIPGMLWVLPPATIEASSPALGVEEFEAVSIQLKNIPSMIGLGSYELEIDYNPRTIRMMRVTDWPMPDKSYVQASSSQSEGKVLVRGTITKKPGPVTNVTLAELIIQGAQPGQSPIGINIKSLKDTEGNPLEATAKPGLVTVKGFTTVEIGSASLVVGTGGKVAVTLKDYLDPEGLGAVWIELAYPRRVLEITSIDAADVPFDKPPQQQTVGVDIPAGVLTLTTSPAKIKSTAQIVLANLTVMPLAEGEFRFTIRGGNLNNSRNQPISAKPIEGTVSARSPFRISTIGISPRQPGIKEKATLTATITNTGSTKATYPARLWVGTSLEDSGAIEVEPNGTRSISFGVTRDVPGAYKAMLGEAELQFTVVNPADLKPGGLIISPAAAASTDTVAISERVENTGKVEGIYTARLKINQVLRDTKEINLKPGEKREVTFSLFNLEPGNYAVDLDGQTASFSVSGEPRDLSSPGTTPTASILAIVAAAEAAAIAFLLFKLGGSKVASS